MSHICPGIIRPPWFRGRRRCPCSDEAMRGQCHIPWQDQHVQKGQFSRESPQRILQTGWPDSAPVLPEGIFSWIELWMWGRDGCWNLLPLPLARKRTVLSFLQAAVITSSGLLEPFIGLVLCTKIKLYEGKRLLITGRLVIPISSTQGTVGPMCRSVVDATLLLGFFFLKGRE